MLFAYNVTNSSQTKIIAGDSFEEALLKAIKQAGIGNCVYGFRQISEQEAQKIHNKNLY